LHPKTPAYNLITVSAYRAAVASGGNGVIRESLEGRECMMVKTQDTCTVWWPIQTGVADRYAITVKYHYPKELPASGRRLLTDAGNSRMMEYDVQITFTRTGKWNQYTVNTPT
jgi:hypothetical protein